MKVTRRSFFRVLAGAVGVVVGAAAFRQSPEVVELFPEADFSAGGWPAGRQAASECLEAQREFNQHFSNLLARAYAKEFDAMIVGRYSGLL